MKRIIPVLLVFVLCLSCMISSVSASGFDLPQTYINILDYATPNNSDLTNAVVSSNGSITFDMTNGFSFNYVDIVFSSTYDVSSLKIGSSKLSLVELEGNIYRAYGSIPYAYYDEFILKFVATDTTLINFFSFHAFNTNYTPNHIQGAIRGTYSGENLIEYVQNSNFASIGYVFNKTTESDPSRYYIPTYLYLYSPVWRYYDFITFRFRSSLNIFSMVGMTNGGDELLPITISSYTDPTYDNVEYILYTVTLDLRNLPKNSSTGDDPFVYINAEHFVNSTAHFDLYDVYGYQSLDYVDPELSFFRKFAAKLETWFSDLRSDLASIITGNPDQEQAADDFNDSVSDQKDELDDMTNIMGSVEKPDVNNIDFNPSTMVDSNTLVLATSGLSDVLGNQIIVRVLLMALTFALVGFILYGKK